MAVWLHKDVYKGTPMGSSKNVLYMLKIIFIDHPNVASMCIWSAFKKHTAGTENVAEAY